MEDAGSEELTHNLWRNQMKVYVQFTRNGEEILGSDGVTQLDGRASLDNMVYACDIRLQHPMAKGATGYRIVRSTRFVDTDDPQNKSKIVYEKEES
jgi:hypothetical protein